MFVAGSALHSAVISGDSVPGLLQGALNPLHPRVTLRCSLWFVCSVPRALGFVLEEKHLISQFFQEIIPDVEESPQTCLNVGIVLGLPE